MYSGKIYKIVFWGHRTYTHNADIYDTVLSVGKIKRKCVGLLSAKEKRPEEILKVCEEIRRFTNFA